MFYRIKFFNALLVIMMSNTLISESIQYSGLSYTTANNDIKDMFPNSLQLEQSLRKTIYKYLNENKSETSNLGLSTSSSFKDGTYSIVIALESENISTINLNNNCLSTFSLGIQVITFSTIDQQIISIKPNAIYRVYYDTPKDGDCEMTTKVELLRFAELFYGVDIPQSEYQKYLVKDKNLIIEEISNLSLKTNSYFKDGEILANVLNQVLSIDIQDIKNTNFFVGIDDVKLGKLGLEQMSGNKEFAKNHIFQDLYGDFQEESYKVWVGQQYSKWFSETFNFPLIPYIKGRALGKDITMKFADGSEALNLRLPSLDFGFVINVKGFKKVKLDESNRREAYAWAAFSGIELHNVGVAKMTEINLKHIYTEEINKGDSVDDWNNFNLSQNRIMKDYISNIKTLNKDWLKRSSKFNSKEFKKHAQVIQDNLGV